MKSHTENSAGKVLWSVAVLGLFLLGGCASTHIIDGKGYRIMAQTIPSSLEERKLPNDPSSIDETMKKNDEPYGKILFARLSPSFLQGRLPIYYIGETFADSMQPRRSTSQTFPTGFTINHVSQRITVSLLAFCDWDDDSTQDMLLSCDVFAKDTGKNTRFYIAAPAPQASDGILEATVIAIVNDKGAVETLADEPKLKKKTQIPPTQFREYRPGEQEITAPPSSQPSQSDTIRERTL